MGHTPFGHAGEEALDAALHARHGLHFRHNEQSLRDRGTAEPDRRGTRRDPHAYGRAASRDPRGSDRADRRPCRVHQPRHRRRDPARDSDARRPAARPRSSCSVRAARPGSTCSCTTSSRARRTAATSARATRSARRCWALRAFMFERVYLAPEARAEHERARHVVQRIFDHLVRARRRAGGDRRVRRRHDRPVRPAVRGRVALVPRIKEASVREVVAAADMVEVVSGRTSLRRAGARFTGRCPFHEERTPSFSVNPSTSCTTASAAARAAT